MSQSQSHPRTQSSPEATFMDQVYSAILKVAHNVRLRMEQDDGASTAFIKFHKATKALVKLQEAWFGGTLLASGVSKWDRVEAKRGQVKELLCRIGDVFANGLAKAVSKSELDRQSLVGTTLPALLASDQASDVSQPLSYQPSNTATVGELADFVRDMVLWIERLAAALDDIPRFSSGGATAARDSCSDPCRRPW